LPGPPQRLRQRPVDPALRQHASEHFDRNKHLLGACPTVVAVFVASVADSVVCGQKDPTALQHARPGDFDLVIARWR
jgi:hypothetical protein